MTTPTLQTAADLRNAAALVTKYGKATEEYIDPQGRVCATGAVRLAVGRYSRITSDFPTERYDFRDNAPGHPDAEEIHHREWRALSALLPLLPPASACGGACCAPESDADLDRAHVKLTRNRRDAIFHYNDFICEGGEALSLLLTQAAEKIEADLP